MKEAPSRPVRAPRGTEISCKGWLQEAALRMIMNNLDPEVAEIPDAISARLYCGLDELGHGHRIALHEDF